MVRVLRIFCSHEVWNEMTKSVPIKCPHCDSEQVIKSGTSAKGTQRYRCKNTACSKTTFLQKYGYKGCMKGVKERIVDMALNGSGVRDTSRVLRISKNTVIDTLKKNKPAWPQWTQTSKPAHRVWNQRFDWSGCAMKPNSTNHGRMSVKNRINVGSGMAWIMPPTPCWPLFSGSVTQKCLHVIYVVL